MVTDPVEIDVKPYLLRWVSYRIHSTPLALNHWCVAWHMIAFNWLTNTDVIKNVTTDVLMFNH